MLYTDDTSGNISKKWHAFNQWCVLLAGLPRHENSSLTNIHFMCCSDKASVLDMAEPIATEIKQLENGLVCYHGHLKCNALILVRVLCVMCDNPRASELLNHAGSAANKYCRMCMVSMFCNLQIVLF